MSFDSLGLSAPLLKAISDKGYQEPSPIQLQAIPAVLERRDLMAAAQTGTGKTAGFTLPLLEILSKGAAVKPKNARALVLTPTRELAAQVSESVETYGKYMNLSCTVVFGGVKIKPQINKLRNGTDILVATPGRLLDLYSQGTVSFKDLEVLILDEADRMLDMGFIHDIKKILAILPKKRQNLMFSATFSNQIRTLAKGLVNNPIEISVTPRNTTVEAIEQKAYSVEKNRKAALLIKLIKGGKWKQVLIFTKTKYGANKLTKNLNSKRISAAVIHGNKSQSARTKALAGFKSGEFRILVATDIAARGLDINQLPHVVNYDLPNVPEDYVHRIGRTGRAGATGEAISLVSQEDIKLLRNIERLIKQNIDIEKIEMPAPKPKPSGSKPSGSKPSGSKPSGSKPSGSKPSGSKPSGSKPSGSKPSGSKPSGSKPSGSKPSGSKPSGSSQKTRTDKTKRSTKKKSYYKSDKSSSKNKVGYKFRSKKKSGPAKNRRSESK